MAKKKTVKTPSVVITPQIKSEGAVAVTTLAKGDCFLFGGALYMMIYTDPEAINLLTGEIASMSEDMLVIPVNIEIKWTPRK